MKSLLILLLLTLEIKTLLAYDCAIEQNVVGLHICNRPIVSPRIAHFYRVGNKWYNEYGHFRFQEIWESDPSGFVIRCEQSGRRSETCEKFANETTTLKYTGSEAFCLEYNCVSEGVITCNCDIGSLNSYVVMLVNGDWSPVLESVSFEVADYDPNYHDPLIQGNNFNKRKLLMSDIVYEHEEAVLYKLEGNVLTFQFLNFDPHFILLSKDGSSTFYTTNSTEYAIHLPNEMTVKSGFIRAEIHNKDGNLVFRVDIYYTAKYKCELEDCLVCEGAVNNWKCLPTTYKWFLGSQFFIMLLLIICLSPFVFAMFSCFFSWIVILPFSIFFRVCKKSYRNAKKSRMLGAIKVGGKKVKKFIVEDDDDAEKQMESQKSTDLNQSILDEIKDEDFEMSTPKKMKPIYTPGGRKVFYTLSFMCLISVSMACDGTILGTASFINCYYPDQYNLQHGIETCDVMFSSSVTLNHLHETICMDLKDTTGRIFKLNFTYADHYQFPSLANDYVTSSWDGLQQSSYNCWSTQHCNHDNDCNNVNSEQLREAYGLISGDVAWYPGKVQCRRSVSCGLTPCFYCTAGCLYSAAALKPRGDIMYVDSVISVRNEPHMEYCYDIQATSNNTYQTCSIVKQVGSIVENFASNKVKVTVVGTLVGDSTIFGTNKIVRKGSETKIISASIPQAPVPQSIGDTQGNAGTYWNRSPNAFIYASGLWSIAQSQTADSYTFLSPGANSFSVGGSSIPGLYGGALWSYDQVTGNLKGKSSNPGALLLNIETVGNWTLTRSVLWVCPIGDFGTAAGCYNCTIGASVIIKLKSTCFDGLVTITADNPAITIFSTSLNIKTSEANYTVNFNTKLKDNSFNLIVKGNAGNATIPVIFTAISQDNINPNGTTYQNNTGDTTDDDVNLGDIEVKPEDNAFLNFFEDTIPDSFKDIFDGSADWWKYLIFSVLLIAALVTIFFLLKPVSSWYLSKFKTMRRNGGRMYQKIRGKSATKKS